MSRRRRSRVGGTQPNYAVNATVRPVTPLAVASVAPPLRQFLLLCLVVLLAPLFGASAEIQTTGAPIVAEVEIEARGDIAKLRVFLVNASEDPQELFTGRVGESKRGQFHSIDLDEVAAHEPFGNGVMVVPHFVFGSVQFEAPTTIASGITWQSMRPTILKLKPRERAHYCSFSVPAVYVSGEFISGKLVFPTWPHGDQCREVRVSRCERKNSTEPAAQQPVAPDGAARRR